MTARIPSPASLRLALVAAALAVAAPAATAQPGVAKAPNQVFTGGSIQEGFLSNATGSAGSLSGYSVLEYGSNAASGGSAQINATPTSRAQFYFIPVIDSGDRTTVGPPANFNTAANYTFTFLRPRTQATSVNPGNTAIVNTGAQIVVTDTTSGLVFSSNPTGTQLLLTNEILNQYITFDTARFFQESGLNGGAVPAGASFSYTLSPDTAGTANRSISLVYNPVPEPASVLAVGALGLAGVYARRRRAVGG